MISKSTIDAMERARTVLLGIPKGAENVMRLAYNRALTTGRKTAVDAVYKDNKFRRGTKGEIKKTFSMRKATRAEVSAELISKGVRLPLHNYAHTPIADTTGSKDVRTKRKKKVRVQISRQASKHVIDKGFIHKGRIFRRLGAPRLPVQMQFGPAIPQLLDKPIEREAVMVAMAEMAEKRIYHETTRLLERQAKKKR